MDKSSDLQAPPVLLTVAQFSAKHPAWTPASLRNLVFKATPRQSTRGQIPGNGLAFAIKRVGRRVLLSERQFFLWVDSQQREAE